MAPVLTIGHSTRAIGEFLDLLEAHAVRLIADVRTIPRSRHNPQFERDALEAALSERGIEYLHIPGLGGLRHARRDSPNTGWENASFRGFADYMQTAGFDQALGELLARTKVRRTALMCAEAVPWRCHRSLIADALTARGVPVEHILSPTRRQPHTLTPFARVQRNSVSYPAPA
jgi:uncharacterized protein (DUF488 family)